MHEPNIKQKVRMCFGFHEFRKKPMTELTGRAYGLN